jgi:hypothetical protein
MQVAQVAECARQVIVYEALRAAHALEADLHVDARGILDVVARGLDDARDLAQLRQDAPSPLGERRVVEERLPGQARRDDVRIVLRAALPRPDLLELEQAGTDARLERGALQPLDVRQARRVDGSQASRETSKIPDLGVNGLTAEVLQEVVVQMDAVEGRVGRMDLVEIGQVLVDEVRKGFG